MKQLSLILQGLTPANHLATLQQLLQISSDERCILSVAFVSEVGVRLLEPHLRPIASRVTVYCGIRNEITSRQALERFLDLGVTLYTVDTGTRQVIFHPKLYITIGTKRAKVVVGSANLTSGGLYVNVEAGFSVDLDLDDPEEAKFAIELVSILDQLPTRYPQNVAHIQSVAELEEMQQSGRLVDESIVIRALADSKTHGLETNIVPRIRLTMTRPSLPLRTLRLADRRLPEVSPPPTQAPSIGHVAESTPTAARYGVELVWESKPLSERDLNIPSGNNTHPTGSINLDKGQLSEEIDHRHYFRDVVFPALDWQSTKKPTVVEAYAKFELVMRGISHGEYTLPIRHTTSTDSQAYRQKNAMTRLSWKSIRPIIARPELIGAALRLYKDLSATNRFIIEIE